MATKLHDTCLDNSEPDEPIFVLVARDRLSLEAVRYWIDLAEGEGVDREKVNDAKNLLQNMADWQVANPDKVKTPD